MMPYFITKIKHLYSYASRFGGLDLNYKVYRKSELLPSCNITVMHKLSVTPKIHVSS